MRVSNQIVNPYLPSFEYIPDGEPHVFGDRIYIYGSHDRFRGAGFCLNDYVCYSAPVDDLTLWRYEGVIYRKDQDPHNQNIPADAPPQKLYKGVVPEKPEDLNPPGVHAMWAPDVVKGLDGKYYLYYCLDYEPEIGVAVSDTPAGAYTYLGRVRHKDGTPLGSVENDLVQFDPGVFIDDDHEIYLYSGNSSTANRPFDGKHHSQVMRLENDMLTIKGEPRMLLPNTYEAQGTDFDGHAFFEASSIRKIDGKYYLIYSSVQSHELNYAVSNKPDRDFAYGGTLIDIGDVFLNGRTAEQSVNALGNTHGSIERINGKWYVFYHRQTNRTNFSRQACAEEITIRPDGSIPQVEVTSCGLNGSALEGKGKYPCCMCCHLTGENGAVFSNPEVMGMEYPYLTQDVDDLSPDQINIVRDRIEPVQYIRNMQDGSTAGYKYLDFKNAQCFSIEARGKGEGVFELTTQPGGDAVGQVLLSANTDQWCTYSGNITVPQGIYPLYITYRGSGSVDIRTFILK